MEKPTSQLLDSRIVKIFRQATNSCQESPNPNTTEHTQYPSDNYAHKQHRTYSSSVRVDCNKVDCKFSALFCADFKSVCKDLTSDSRRSTFCVCNRKWHAGIHPHSRVWHRLLLANSRCANSGSVCILRSLHNPTIIAQ